MTVLFIIRFVCLFVIPAFFLCCFVANQTAVCNRSINPLISFFSGSREGLFPSPRCHSPQTSQLSQPEERSSGSGSWQRRKRSLGTTTLATLEILGERKVQQRCLRSPELGRRLGSHASKSYYYYTFLFSCVIHCGLFFFFYCFNFCCPSSSHFSFSLSSLSRVFLGFVFSGRGG